MNVPPLKIVQNEPLLRASGVTIEYPAARGTVRATHDVSFDVWLAMQPAVLLMDEPFAALDALTRRRMQEELQALWEEDRFTMPFVTPSIEEALVVGNRILLLFGADGQAAAEPAATPATRAVLP